jgi:hypothetical protein
VGCSWSENELSGSRIMVNKVKTWHPDEKELEIIAELGGRQSSSTCTCSVHARTVIMQFGGKLGDWTQCEAFPINSGCPVCVWIRSMRPVLLRPGRFFPRTTGKP